MAARQREMLLAQLVGDARRLASAQGVQAYCLECPADLRPVAGGERRSLAELWGALFSS
jgi:protease-4